MISINKRIICSIGLLQEGSTQKGKHYHFIIVARAIAVYFFSKETSRNKKIKQGILNQYTSTIELLKLACKPSKMPLQVKP